MTIRPSSSSPWVISKYTFPTQLANTQPPHGIPTYLVCNLRALGRLGRLRKEDKSNRKDQEDRNDESLNRRHNGWTVIATQAVRGVWASFMSQRGPLWCWSCSETWCFFGAAGCPQRRTSRRRKNDRRFRARRIRTDADRFATKYLRSDCCGVCCTMVSRYLRLLMLC
jgi:hypothetical protein